MHLCLALDGDGRGAALVEDHRVDGAHVAHVAHRETLVAGDEALARIERVEEADDVDLGLEEDDACAEHVGRVDDCVSRIGEAYALTSIMRVRATIVAGTCASRVMRMRRAMSYGQCVTQTIVPAWSAGLPCASAPGPRECTR